MNYIDLFAGAGGLSEGFIREGFKPIAHVEMSKEACDTLRTRIAFHYLSSENPEFYDSYLKGALSRQTLWGTVPENLMRSVINQEISSETINPVFEQIDGQLEKRKVDVVIGGPPCQAYSLVGRSRDPKGMKWDKRNFLFRYYAQFLLRYRPKYFVFENVVGLLSAGNKRYLTEMLKLFSEVGYSTDFRILNAADYGVLQKRKRVVIIGRKGRQEFPFPELERSVFTGSVKKDLFYDLPFLKPGDELHVTKYTKPINEYLSKSQTRNGVDFVTQHITRQHNERDLEIYMIAIRKWIDERKRLKYSELPKELQTHSNIKSHLDRFKVIDPSGCSHTVVAHLAKDGHYYIYPDLHQIRSISVREAARLQSFPDSYFFEGGRTAAFKQIGNAVPPLMAQAIARGIKSIL